MKRRRLTSTRGAAAAASLVGAVAIFGVFLSAQASAVPVALPTISIADAEGTNYQSGTTTMKFDVTLSAASTATVSVDWATRPSEEVEELVQASGTLTFAPGETRKTIEVQIEPEPQLTEEEDEIFYVDLSNPVNATLDKGVGVGILHFQGKPGPTEVNVYTRGGSGQCVKTVDSNGCEPILGEKQFRIDDIVYINPGRKAVDLETTEGVVRFHGGVFGLDRLSEKQSGTGKPVIVAALRGGNFNKACKARTAASTRSTTAAKPKPVRRLWGKGSGRFRTRGRYSSGTVRGTWWETIDRCDGTRTIVKEGVVSVYDFALKKHIRVEAGHSYFARKP